MEPRALATVLVPELILTGLAFLVLAVDLVWWGHRPPGVRTTWLGWLSLVGLGAAGAALPCARAHAEGTVFLGGMLVITPFTSLAAFIVLGISAFTILLSMGEEVRHAGEYYALLLFATLGMLFLVLAEELIMIFVALELMSVSLYLLTAFHKGLRRSAEASVKYFLFGALSSAFLYYGASLLYGLTGTTNLPAIGAAAGRLTHPLGADQALLAIALIFTLVGFGFKLALVPFHLWAPDAYEGAPTPVTAFISTGSKAASVVVLLKVLFLGFAGAMGSPDLPVGARILSIGWQPGWASVLALLATLAMTVGNLVAIHQRNLKRLLAYSSIAHAGYLVVGIVAGTASGIAAVLYYLVAYALTNLGAFGTVAAISRITGGDDIQHLAGMGRRAPVLSFCMILFMLSLAGLPPLAGFFGKFYLFLAAAGHETTHWGLLWLVAVAIVNSAISLYYYLLILKQMYVVEPPSREPAAVAAPLLAAVTLCAALVVGLGLHPAPFLALLHDLVVTVPIP